MANVSETARRPGASAFAQRLTRAKRSYELYLFLLPTLLYFAIFHYGPMYGIQIAFRDYLGALGIWGSPWVGLEHFKRFFDSTYFVNLLSNTILLSFFGLIFDFPVPILFALMLNQIGNKRYRKLIQTISYAPHFISTVVFVGIIFIFLSPSTGIVNILLDALGLERTYFMGSSAWFRPVYVISNIWKGTGWGAIIYLATLAGINPELYESAYMDGAGRFRRMWSITIPSLRYAITILLILDMGYLMEAGFQQIFNLYSPTTYEVGDIIDTYVYRLGLQSFRYEWSTAIGLFKSVINCTLLLTTNAVVKLLGGEGVF